MTIPTQAEIVSQCADEIMSYYNQVGSLDIDIIENAVSSAIEKSSGEKPMMTIHEDKFGHTLQTTQWVDSDGNVHAIVDPCLKCNELDRAAREQREKLNQTPELEHTEARRSPPIEDMIRDTLRRHKLEHPDEDQT